MIDKDYFRCSKCDTEFILDSDDVNVNVNYNYRHYNNNAERRTSTRIGFIAIFIIVIVLVGIVFGISIVTSYINKNNTRRAVLSSTTQTVKSDILLSVLLPVNEKAVVFYIEDKSTFLKDKGYSAVFHDLANGVKIKQFDGLFANETIKEIECRKFISDKSCYLIVNNSHLYKVETDALINMYDEISAKKPVLNSGYSKIYFTPEGCGEGFSLETKLGKQFYYYPASDALYTENAMNHVMKGAFGTLSPEATDETYYLFRNKSSKQSSNVSEIMEIKYKFNNGGPESKLLEFDRFEQNGSDIYRIVSNKPITKEFISFSAKILYYDKKNILITYKETLAEDAVRQLQLFDTQGAVIWTVPMSYNMESDYSLRTERAERKMITQKMHNIKTNNGFVIQNERNSFLEISADGKTIKNYKLPK